MSRLAKKSGLVFGLAALCCLAWPLASWGTTISDPGSLNSGATIIDFEGYAVHTTLPITSGIATISANSTAAQVMDASGNGFTDNSGIVDGNMVGYGAITYTVTFSAPVAQFGLGVAGSESTGNTLKAYDKNNIVLESIDLSHPGSTSTIYAGFIRTANDIDHVVLSQYYVDAMGIDNVSYYALPVPVPPTLLLLGSGLLGLLGLGRRKFFPKN
jgi:hypothetical protein